MQAFAQWTFKANPAVCALLGASLAMNAGKWYWVVFDIAMIALLTANTAGRITRLEKQVEDAR